MILALLLGCAAQAVPPGSCPVPFDRVAPQAGWNRGFSAGGQSRSFYLMLPRASDHPAPLLFAFNGTTEDGASFAARARLQDFVDKGFIVVAPSSNANGTYWPVWDALRARGHESDPNPDLALFDTLLACLPSHLSIDPDRVFAGGHSAGGIFTNFLLQRRSDVLAGAIVASGIHSQTAPSPPIPLSPTTVIVTWGGDNDRWSGRAGTAAVKDFSFATEAAVASQIYAKAGLGVAACKGDELGHAWLDGLNSWMADIFLTHPRGTPLAALPPLPSGADARCSFGAVQDAPRAALTCGASATPGCQQVCQGLADGVVTNRTLQAVLAGPMRHFGFEGEGCGGCLAWCEGTATATPDAEALACFTQRPAADPSVAGIAGAMPLIDAVNDCCADHADSGFCRDVCGTMRKNLAARAYFEGCAE